MAVNSGERALWVSGGVAQSTQCACGARAPAGGRHEAVLARLPATLVCIGRPRGLFDQTSDHSILAGVRTASLGGTLLSQTAQPGITAATTALAVEHNSLRRIRDTAAALAAFSRDPQLYLAGFDR
jgi:hypothetical protein